MREPWKPSPEDIERARKRGRPRGNPDARRSLSRAKTPVWPVERLDQLHALTMQQRTNNEIADAFCISPSALISGYRQLVLMLTDDPTCFRRSR